MKRTRRSKSKNQRRKRTLKRGGAAEAVPFDCAAEGFNITMREAAFGRGYTIGVGGIHDDGEQWPYDMTAHRIMGGMIDWYRRTLEEREIITPYTEEEIQALKSNEILKDLGVFFNRYKIVAEKLPVAIRLFNGGLRSICTSLFSDPRFAGPESFGNFLDTFTPNAPRLIKIGTGAKKSLEILATFKDIDFRAKDFPIEVAIDRVQCIIFYIVKHKGELPPGFVMDERITRRAHEELKMSMPSDILRRDEPFFFNGKLMAVQRWLSFLNESYTELSEPPVTFGLVWP
jgi:hypothetical protein